MNLYASYKKRLYAPGGSLIGYSTDPEVQAAQQAQGVFAQTGAAVGTGVIDMVDKGDPLTGRQSIGSSAGKGALNGAAMGMQAAGPIGAAAGAVIGGAVGFFKGRGEMKEARAQLHTSMDERARLDQDRSAARIGADPTLYTGFKGASYYSAGGEMDPGGLWKTNRSMWVDSTNKANLSKNFIQRMYAKHPESIQIPGQSGRSTHFMANDGQYAYPSVVQKDGKLQYLKGDDAYNYAEQTGERIKFQTPGQASWYAANGYKTGPGVLKGFAGGGEMGPGDPPARLGPAEMQQWNGFLDFVKTKGMQGHKDLDMRNKNLGASLFDEYKKSSPGVNIDYNIVPRVQQEFSTLQDSTRGFAARRNDPKAASLYKGISKEDGWFGSRTSQQYFPSLEERTVNSSGQVISSVNRGLINGKLQPSGTGANPVSPGRHWDANDAGVVDTGDGRLIAPDGTELKACGGMMKPNSHIRRMATGGAMPTPLAYAYANGGRVKSLSSTNGEFVGPSHEQGGIQLPQLNAETEGGETTAGNFVFSKRLGFADEHRKIARAKGIIEEKPATRERINSMRRLAQREQQMAEQQEQLKGALGLQ